MSKKQKLYIDNGNAAKMVNGKTDHFEPTVLYIPLTISLVRKVQFSFFYKSYLWVRIREDVLM